MFENMLKMIRHYRGTSVAAVICCIVLLMTFGCESKVASLTDPSIMVTREQLAVEASQVDKRLMLTTKQQVAALQAQIDAVMAESELSAEDQAAAVKFKEANLDRQDQLKKVVAEVGLLYATGGGINPLGIIFTLAGILGAGSVVDNYRKDGLLKTPKAVAARSSTT